MKTPLTFLLLCLTLAPHLALAQEVPPPDGGVSGSGGGDALVSTPKEVAALIQKLNNDRAAFAIMSEAQTRQFLNPDYVTDPELKELFRAFSRDSNGVEKGNALEAVSDASTHMEPKTRCMESGVLKDGATGFYRRAPICINVKTMARYAPARLKEEILILQMHELAHHFVGDNEALAQKFQNYMEPFVREFVAAGRLFQGGAQDYKTVYELRPGGSVRVNTPAGNVVVSCARAGENPNALLNPGSREMNLVVRAGEPLSLGTAGNLTAVLCKSLPTVDCRIVTVDGQKRVDYAGLRNFWTSFGQNPEENLARLRLANICHRADASSLGAPTGTPAGGTSAR